MGADDVDGLLRFVVYFVAGAGLLLTLILWTKVGIWAGSPTMIAGTAAALRLEFIRHQRLLRDTAQKIASVTADELVGLVETLLRASGYAIGSCERAPDVSSGAEVIARAVNQETDLEVLIAVDRGDTASQEVVNLATQNRILLLDLPALTLWARGRPLPTRAHRIRRPE
ncbi:hypothetical protein [Candidatus Frankia nodulisporulans]|uniref:hypothetical protein n=1 Tax=Candidatus Frankia nodulisporulans TaxID=2060052 RepID=UPI0013D16FFC|nr:hypothetical protein [Candidatus Frankia nodulisporulans]